MKLQPLLLSKSTSAFRGFLAPGEDDWGSAGSALCCRHVWTAYLAQASLRQHVEDNVFHARGHVSLTLLTEGVRPVIYAKKANGCLQACLTKEELQLLNW